MSILSSEVERTGRLSMAVIDKDGNALLTDGSIIQDKDRKFFIDAMAGKSNVSDPIVNRADGNVIVIYAVPIKNNNTVEAVLLSLMDGNSLSDLTIRSKLDKLVQHLW